MLKHYIVGNGHIYSFDDVHMEFGELCGTCTSYPNKGKFAWLDSNGFQFETGPHIKARPMDEPVVVDNSYAMWGGELRDKLPHGARYYQRGKRW